jgi:acylphosphatase
VRAVARERLTAIVRGRVQGVGFRYFALERASRLGLTGYARNLPGGRSVEVVAEGERPALEALLADLSRGPAGARVEDVRADWGPEQAGFGDFDVCF